MAEKGNSKTTIAEIADDYFAYLGRHLPQQCASDEFYFLPRSESAVRHLGILDDLTPDMVQGHIGYVRGLLNRMPSEKTDDLEEEVDRSLLRQSMRGFIREFENAKVWEKDPTLYIKIPLLAVDHILSRGDESPRDKTEVDLFSLFDCIPEFLRLATRNLHLISETALEVSLGMVHDAIHFFRYHITAYAAAKIGDSDRFSSKNRVLLDAWEQYGKDLFQISLRDSFAIGEEALMEILQVSLSYPESPDKILEQARLDCRETGERLSTLAGEVEGGNGWKEIEYELAPKVSSPEDLLNLFRREIQKLRHFFSKQDILSFPVGEKVHVRRTPSYLESLRAAASYRAPLTGEKGGHGVFYINPVQDDLRLIASHSPYLSAHEAYPGHHILDNIRIHLANPIRRQIESPLFYEGWACYAEQLLDEMGYISNPRQQLIGLKRRLWRNLRAVLDIELQTGRITPDQASRKIEALGFPLKRARRQVRRFCVTPGYQLCYSVGMYEIIRLRDRFSTRMEQKEFHDILLGGGQIPFHLAERRLDAYRAR